MKVFVFISRKGGVGKTTCAYNVALGLPFAIQGEDSPWKKRSRILIIDLDRQKDMTFRFDKDYIEDSPQAENGKKSLYDFLTCPEIEGELLSCVHFHRTGAVVYGSSRNAEIRKLFADNPRILAQRLALVAPHFDACILDLPPAQDEISFGALVAGDYAFPCSDLTSPGTYGVRDAMIDIMAVKKLTGHTVKVPIVLVYASKSKRERFGEWFAKEIKRYTSAQLFFIQFDDMLLDQCVIDRKTIYSYPLKFLARNYAELCVVCVLYFLNMPLRRPAYSPFASFYKAYEADYEKKTRTKREKGEMNNGKENNNEG